MDYLLQGSDEAADGIEVYGKSGVTAESHRRSNIEEFGKVPRQNDMGLLISHSIYATNKAVSTVPSQRAMVSLV